MSTRTAIATILTAATISTSGAVFVPHSAEARPTTRSFTCQGVRNHVRRRGAVVMNTTSSRIYRRFIANRSYCYPREDLKRYSVPTKSGRCTLYICHEFEYDFWPWRD